MSEPGVRRVAMADLAAVRELVVELGYDVEQGALESTLAMLSSSESSVVLVHESDGQVDALVALSFRPQLHRAAITTTIDELVTRREHRGRGIGHALIEA